MPGDASLRVAPAIEAALWSAAQRLLPGEALGRAALKAAIGARSRRYTSERERLADAVTSRKRHADLAARAVFFSVCDAPKLRVPIFELAGRSALPAREPLRILDLGAGCGATTLGALDALALAGVLGPERPPAEILAVDRDEEALSVFGEALREAPWRELASSAVERADAAGYAFRGGPYDLVLAGALTNEMAEAEALALLQRALGALAPDGALVVIEPALRETSRGLHRLRDAAVAGGAHVFAPCTRSLPSCPALEDPRDWCHEDRPVALSPRARALADATGLREHGAKFSYLVLRNEPRALASAGPDTRALRVVSRVRKLKGRSECFACSDEGRVRIRRLKRDRSGANRGLDRARRGDVLVAPTSAAETGQVGAEDELLRLEPAKPPRSDTSSQ